MPIACCLNRLTYTLDSQTSLSSYAWTRNATMHPYVLTCVRGNKLIFLLKVLFGGM